MRCHPRLLCTGLDEDIFLLFVVSCWWRLCFFCLGSPSHHLKICGLLLLLIAQNQTFPVVGYIEAIPLPSYPNCAMDENCEMKNLATLEPSLLDYFMSTCKDVTDKITLLQQVTTTMAIVLLHEMDSVVFTLNIFGRWL